MKRLLFFLLLICTQAFAEDIALKDAPKEEYIDKGDSFDLSVAEDVVKIDKDSPTFTLNRWGGESAIIVKRAGEFTTSEKEPLSDKRTITSLDGKESVIFEPKEDGVKIDILLHEKPEKNVFDLEIENWEDFDFYYQPALTPEEIAEGAVRPDDVVGSYAVYHRARKGNKYQTGKAFHIYRPKIIDDFGTEVWGELDFKDGVLSVIVPQEFLDIATYPVRVDPTFGNTTCGASNSTRAADAMNAVFKTNTVPISGTVEYISFCFDGNTVGTVNAKGVLYNYIADANTIVTNGVSPSVLLPATASGAYTTSYYSSKPSLTAGSAYSPALVGDGTIRYYYDTAGTGGWFDDSNSYATPQDSGTQTSSTRLMSIYISYNVIGNTQAGASTTSTSANNLYCSKGSVTGDGTVSSISARLFGSGVNWKGVLLDSSKNIVTNGVGSVMTSTGSYSLLTSTFSTPPTVSTGTYFACVIPDASGGVRYDARTAVSLNDTTNSYTTPENATGVADADFWYTIYAEYSADVLTDSLISHWKLNEASGTRDDAHSTNDLGDNATVTSATGKIGDAADFEATNSEYLSLADNAALSTGDIDFTWAGWVNIESLPTNNNSYYIASKHGASGNYEYGITVQNDANVIRFGFNVSNNGTAVVTRKADTFGTPSTATWYFIVAWHDASANTINIQVNNGTADSTSHTTGVFDGNGTFALGAYAQTPSNFFDGLIDSVSFWKRTLTTQEKIDLYNGGSGLDYDFTGGGAASSIKTWNGLADASVKTGNGLARASVKTKDGLA